MAQEASHSKVIGLKTSFQLIIHFWSHRFSKHKQCVQSCMIINMRNCFFFNNLKQWRLESQEAWWAVHTCHVLATEVMFGDTRSNCRTWTEHISQLTYPLYPLRTCDPPPDVTAGRSRSGEPGLVAPEAAGRSSLSRGDRRRAAGSGWPRPRRSWGSAPICRELERAPSSLDAELLTFV